ncbi:hypothetical protein [Micromonospora sp. NPDC002575]|uniref:hypothetical protein n=1 Tax=Micromonospora sp. NPDC002575 TaxID=3364222 RepID=UPI003693E0B1
MRGPTAPAAHLSWTSAYVVVGLVSLSWVLLQLHLYRRADSRARSAAHPMDG